MASWKPPELRGIGEMFNIVNVWNAVMNIVAEDNQNFSISAFFLGGIEGELNEGEVANEP